MCSQSTAARSRSVWLHETSQDYCANYGLIVLHCCGSEEEVGQLVSDLNAVDGVSAKSMGMDM